MSSHNAPVVIIGAGIGGLPEHLHLGCQAVALEEGDAGMRVRCASGAVFDAGLVVGADGVHSLARSWVTGGDEPLYSGTSGFRGLVPAARLAHLPDPGALQLWMGPGAHLLHLSHRAGPRDQLPRRDRHAPAVDGAGLDGTG